MDRLAKVWSKEKAKKDATSKKTISGEARRKRVTSASTENLPRYMQPTIAAKNRVMTRGKSAAATDRAASLQSKPRSRAPLRPVRQDQHASNNSRSKAPQKSGRVAPPPADTVRSKRTRKSASPAARKKTRTDKLSENTANAAKVPFIKVESTETKDMLVEGAEDNLAGSSQIPKAEVKKEISECSPSPQPSLAQPTADGETSQRRESFAPVETKFTFQKTLSAPHVHFSTPSRATNLESIAEMNSTDTDDGAELQEMNSTLAGRTPARKRSRLVGASCTPLVSPDIPASPGTCKYSVLHSARQKVLSEKLRSAKGADEKLNVLSQSPMIEMKRRKSSKFPLPPQLQIDQPTADEEKSKTVEDFRQLVLTYTKLLGGMAQHWELVNQQLDVDEDVHGEVRSTACQARLIIAERFKQFNGLIDNCEHSTGIKPVHLDDLQGFWEMIFYQVEDVLAKFKNLETRKEQGWTKATISPVVKKVKAKRKVAKPVRKVASKFAAFRANMKKERTDEVHTMDDAQMDKESADAQMDKKSADAQMDKKSADVAKCIKKTPAARKSVEAAGELVKTYSLRKETMEQCFSSRLNRRRSTRNSLQLPKVTPRSKQRSSIVASAHNVASPVLTRPQSSVSKSVNHKQSLLGRTGAASPELSFNCPDSAVKRRSSIASQRRKSCSPSATMVRAMLNASKSGRATQPNSPLTTLEEKSLDSSNEEAALSSHEVAVPSAKRKRRQSTCSSLHKQVLTKKLETPGANFSPSTLFGKLNLDGSGISSPANDGKNLMSFTPLPSTPLISGQPTQTPRRSARIAVKNNSRLSLL